MNRSELPEGLLRHLEQQLLQDPPKDLSEEVMTRIRALEQVRAGHRKRVRSLLLFTGGTLLVGVILLYFISTGEIKDGFGSKNPAFLIIMLSSALLFFMSVSLYLNSEWERRSKNTRSS